MKAIPLFLLTTGITLVSVGALFIPLPAPTAALPAQTAQTTTISFAQPAVSPLVQQTTITTPLPVAETPVTETPVTETPVTE